MQPSPFSALMEITARPELVFERGAGSWLWDSEGRAYLDFVQGWAVNALGHAPPELAEAIAAQAARLINPGPGFYNRPALQLAAGLTRASGLDRVFFANSGAEANEGAIKLARKWGGLHRGGAYEIVTLEHGFHGRTLATMSATGKPQWRELFEPKVPGFPKVPAHDLTALEAAIGPQTVAVMLEPIQGEAGVIPLDPAYLRAVRALTEARGLLLIADEIQTGMGRTGTLFACDQAGVRPDLMTLGKGLGGGVPLAALLAREAVCCFAPGDQGGTFNGNPLMTAAGAVVLERVERPEFLAEVRARGERLAVRLGELAARYGAVEVRGRGLLRALELAAPVAGEVVERARARGLLLNAPRPATLRFMPALTVTAAEIDEMAARLDRVLGKVGGARSS